MVSPRSSERQVGGEPAGSPEANTVGGGLPHPVARLRAERLVEAVAVDGRAVGAELRRRVGVGGDLVQHRLVAQLLAPGLRKAVVEALLAREAVYDRRGLAGQRDL